MRILPAIRLLLQPYREVAIPNMQRLLAGFRKAGIEVLHTTIERLTKDAATAASTYKITGFNVPKGSWDGR